jgi:hypothetical protein
MIVENHKDIDKSLEPSIWDGPSYCKKVKGASLEAETDRLFKVKAGDYASLKMKGSTEKNIIIRIDHIEMGRVKATVCEIRDGGHICQGDKVSCSFQFLHEVHDVKISLQRVFFNRADKSSQPPPPSVPPARRTP